MNQLPIVRDNFVCFAIEDGDINYPDDVELFSSTVIVHDPETDSEYLACEYDGEKSLPKDLSYDKYFDLAFREDFIEAAMRTIKEAQAKELGELEGANGVNQRKAIEKITTDGTYAPYDELIKRKAFVRNHGNDMEQELETMPAEELVGFTIEFKYEHAPDLVLRRITVGAFELRFSVTEQQRITEAKKASPELERNYNSMISRTHIHLDAPELKPVLDAMAQGGLLDAEPADGNFDSRVDEILRNGALDEQHRVLSYV